jgi:AcrR family transcriptional regulator
MRASALRLFAMVEAPTPRSVKRSSRAPRSLPRSSAVEAGDSEVVAAIISAAVIAMAENGYHGTSVREIASRADLSMAALYHHFGSKEGLLFEIMRRGNDRLYKRAALALRKAGSDPVAGLRALVGLFVQRHLVSQRESFLGSTELRSLEPESRALIIGRRDQIQRLFDGVVLDGVQQGVFTTPFPTEAARAIVTMCGAVAGWYRPGGSLAPEEIVDRYQELCLATVGWVRVPDVS